MSTEELMQLDLKEDYLSGDETVCKCFLCFTYTRDFTTILGKQICNECVETNMEEGEDTQELINKAEQYYADRRRRIEYFFTTNKFII